MTATTGPRTGRVRQSALREAHRRAPHAVLLDGIQVLRRPRYETPELPALMLTARGADLAEVHLSGPRRKTDRGRARTIHAVRVPGYPNRTAGDGR
ncbi:hypothetical protein [Streptomyces griseorubiginosus]|uniref:hypothetical protein n=1 Tax=Streptomyces griseorubiginosus TaxID=67304 RepID=UPI0036E2380B